MLAKNKIRLWLRRIHRDAGYFVVGITLVYALSGIFLHHKMGVKTIKESLQLSSGLSADRLKTEWTSIADGKEITYLEERPDQVVFYFPGGMGEYNQNTGITNFETYKDRPLVIFMSRLHENQIKGWGFIADIYAVILIFLAISGLFMVPGKNGFFRRGVWWFLAGVILVVMFGFL
ncbi:PepSY-associated TM helix domain-containing protein [Thermophagus sp. OGC60D27]|uniref:PepSY-associated TM helix domain-containing protein n=1 Tax=Thermophagus sp. OGC60D27 TaxID=3458415 RepID=UPI004037D6A5